MSPGRGILAEIDLESLEQCRRIGHHLGEILEPGDTVLLEGDLGVGKTTLTGFLARGLGVDGHELVTSPSFALVHEYLGRCPLYHMDCYRLTGEEDVEAAGLSEYLESPLGVCVVEWPQRLGSLWPENGLEIRIVSRPGERRTFVFSGCQRWLDRLCPVLRNHP